MTDDVNVLSWGVIECAMLGFMHVVEWADNQDIKIVPSNIFALHSFLSTDDHFIQYSCGWPEWLWQQGEALLFVESDYIWQFHILDISKS